MIELDNLQKDYDKLLDKDAKRLIFMLNVQVSIKEILIQWSKPVYLYFE